MDYSLIARLRIKELVHQWRFSLVFVISLVLSFVFLILFASKLFNISASFDKADFKQVDNITYMQQTPLQGIFWQDEENYTRIHKAKLIVRIGDRSVTHKVFSVSQDIDHYYKDLEIPKNFEIGSKTAIVDRSFLEVNRLKIGDEFVISDQTFTIVGSHEAYYFKNSILIPHHTLLTPHNSYEEMIILNPDQSKDEQLIEAFKAKNYQPGSLRELQIKEKQSLTTFLAFVAFTSAIFFMISFTNCLLSFEGRRKYLQRTSSIHRLIGSTSKQQSMILFVESCLLGLVALNSAWWILQFTKIWIPAYFKVEGSLFVLTLSHAIMILLIFLFTLYTYRKIHVNNIIADLKEVS